MDFTYSLTIKSDIAIITLSGKMEKEAREALVKCSQETHEKSVKYIILYFKNVPTIDSTIYREMAMFQLNFRKAGIEIRLAGLDSKLKTMLVDKGIIRASETRNTVEEALESRFLNLSNKPKEVK